MTGVQTCALPIYRQSLARYVFDKELRVFERYTGQESHLTPQGQKILVSNVIVQYVPYRVVDGDGRLQLILHGEGKAKIFRDGKVINGLWQKQPGGFTKFVDNKGKVIPLMPGPTWINVVTNGTRVDY